MGDEGLAEAERSRGVKRDFTVPEKPWYILSNTEPLHYSRRCLKSDFHIKAQICIIVSRWPQLSHFLHECQRRKKLLAGLKRAEFSICLTHCIPQGIGGQNLQKPWPQ